MTLSSEHSEFKTCPNCRGEGWEPKPPMRKCRLCKGTGKLPDKCPTIDRRTERSAPLAPSHEACTQGQGG